MVGEADPGRFGWVLAESVGDAVVYDEEVSRSPASYRTYIEAMDAGVAAWKALCSGQLHHGPRREGEDERGNPVGHQDGATL